MVDIFEPDVQVEQRDRVWYVVWRRPGDPPRLMMCHLALNEAHRAEDRGDVSLATKLRDAAAEARNKNASQ